MNDLEKKILNSFKKNMGKEVESLDLFVAFNDDTWPDDEGYYLVEVMERQDNGKVWTCQCTKNGIVKDVYEVG